MAEWLEWARGPAFRFAFALMILGLLRLFILNAVNIVSIVRHANNKDIPLKAVLMETLKWFYPFKKIGKRNALFGAVSLLFHVGILITPVFLAAHILLWKRSVGLGWPALGQGVADTLTVMVVICAVVLLAERVLARASRSLSRVQDFVLPVLIAIPFASGYLAMHPWMNPFAYDATMFVHVMSGNLIFVLLPFSKLSHAVLFPTNQLVSEVGWYFVPDSGSRVAVALGKEGEKI